MGKIKAVRVTIKASAVVPVGREAEAMRGIILDIQNNPENYTFKVEPLDDLVMPDDISAWALEDS